MTVINLFIYVCIPGLDIDVVEYAGVGAADVGVSGVADAKLTIENN